MRRKYDADLHCGRKTRAGTPCVQFKGARTDHPGEGACWLHGGRSPRGKASATYKHGRRSKFVKTLPERLRRYVEDVVGDPSYRELRGHVAVADALIQQIAAGLDGSASPEAWSDALGYLVAAERAIAARDTGALADALSALRQTLRAGLHEAEARRELLAAMDKRRRLTETENKRVVQEHAILRMDEAVMVFERLGALVVDVLTHVEGALREAGIDADRAARVTDGARRVYETGVARVVGPLQLN